MTLRDNGIMRGAFRGVGNLRGLGAAPSGATTFAGFKILCTYANWIAVAEIRMTDHDDNEFVMR